MQCVIAAIQVEAPVDRVFAQWAEFRQYPLFMESLERSTQIDAHGIRWFVKVDGAFEEWKVNPALLIPRRRLSWKVVEGPEREHTVTFHDAGAACSLVRHRVDSAAPEPWTEARVAADLERMKRFVEAVPRA